MKTYFTFGQDHAHRINGKTLDKDWVVEMETKTREEAREKMFEFFGQKWSNQYNKKPTMSFYPKGIIKL